MKTRRSVRSVESLKFQNHTPFVLVLLTTFVFSSESTPAASEHINSASKIAHGSPAAPQEFPFLVQLIVLAGNQTEGCGGSIIAPNLILTAGHCTNDIHRLDYPNMYRMYIIAGELKWGSVLGLKVRSQVKQVVDIVRHEDYDKRTNQHDLAILVLADDLIYSKYVQPVNLPEPGQTFSGIAQISGWGTNETGGSQAEKLHKATVPILDGSECVFEDLNNTALKYDDETMICAGGNWTDTCKGDSGGPLLCKSGSSSNSKQYLCGITSWGPGCGNFSIPTVYTRVATHVSWIKNFIKNYKRFECPAGQFDCGDRRCVPCNDVCNGVKECRSGLDEAGCGRCKYDEFRCATKNKCVPMRFICDGDDDCGDGSDELGCGRCASTEFSCPDASCVSPFCDRLSWSFGICHKAQCRNYTFSPPCGNGASPQIKCTKKANGKCVLGFQTCDSDSSSVKTESSDDGKSGACTATQFRCGKDLPCLPLVAKCFLSTECHLAPKIPSGGDSGGQQRNKMSVTAYILLGIAVFVGLVFRCRYCIMCMIGQFSNAMDGQEQTLTESPVSEHRVHNPAYAGTVDT